MKLKFTKAIIENILNTTINFVDKKDNSLITSHILIEANENIKFRATDKEFGIEYIDNTSQIIEKGSTTINGKRFYEIIKALNDDFIDIEVNDNIVTISQNHSVYRLPVFDVNEFPKFPDKNNLKNIEIKSKKFIEGLKKTLPVIDTNNPKYELNGALIDISQNSINLVSTDTKRLAIVTINQNIDRELQIIIPKKAIAEIKKMFLDEFKVYADNTNLIIESKNITLFTQLINGSFPDYKRIIPSEYRYILELNKKDFVKTLKQINIISNSVKITIIENKIEFESISDETFEAKTDITITNSDIEYFAFAVNSKFILDFLNVIDEENFEMCLNEENIPFTLKNKNFQTIIMPITI